MLVYHGTRLFGKHDRVKTDTGQAYTATMMIHGWWLPVLPKGTFFVFPNGTRVRVPTTLRSLTLAYLSSWPVLFALVTLLGAPVFWGQASMRRSIPTTELAIAIVLTAVGAISFIWSLGWRFVPGLGKATRHTESQIKTWLSGGLKPEDLR